MALPLSNMIVRQWKTLRLKDSSLVNGGVRPPQKNGRCAHIKVSRVTTGKLKVDLTVAIPQHNGESRAHRR